MEKKLDPYALSALEKKKMEREEDEKRRMLMDKHKKQLKKEKELVKAFSPNASLDKKATGNLKNIKKNLMQTDFSEKNERKIDCKCFKLILDDKFIEKDTELFQTQISNYNDYLTYLRRDEEQVDKGKEEEMQIKKKFNISPENLKSLNFKAKVYFAPPEQKKEDDNVDM